MMSTAHRPPRRQAGQRLRTSARGCSRCSSALASAWRRARPPPSRPSRRTTLPSTPENVVWGWFPIDREPVLTIRSGETVRIDTLTHAGATQAEDPERYLNQFGVAPEEILQDVIDFWLTRGNRPARGPERARHHGADLRRGCRAGRHARSADPVHRDPRALTASTTPPRRAGCFSPDYPGSSPA